MIKLKHWMLAYYLWISIGLFILATVVGTTLFGWGKLDATQALSILLIPAAVFVALQKQKTEELQLFACLFKDFNKRYDRMNEELNGIVEGDAGTALTKKEIQRLYDYFNLCGEEYLFYRQGYIYPEVWSAWCCGMKYFRRCERIRKLWDEELKQGSYYGIRFDC